MSPQPGEPTVRPRVRPREAPGALAVLLEEAVAPWLEPQGRGTARIALVAPAGGGKSTALGLLRARFGDAIAFLDEPEPGDLRHVDARRPLVYAAHRPLPGKHQACLELAPWDADDVLDHLMALAPERAGELFPGLVADPLAPALRGSPELWSAAIGEILARPPACGLDRALQRRVRDACGSAARRRMIARASHALLHGDEELALRLWQELVLRYGDHEPGDTLVRHTVVRRILARDLVALWLRAGHADGRVSAEIDADLGEAVGRRVAALPRVRRILEARLLQRSKEPTAPEQGSDRRAGEVAILHAMDPGWLAHLCASDDAMRVHAQGTRLAGLAADGATCGSLALVDCDLARASLAAARIDTLDVSRSSLVEADLHGMEVGRLFARNADLRRARLELLRAGVALLPGADLRGASLREAHLGNADLVGADLEDVDLGRASLPNANLGGARLGRTILRDASLAGARLDDVDLRTADLVRCDLAGALLRRVHLGGVRIDAARLQRVDLTGADLSGSDLPGADLFLANLAGAGLHGVRWRRSDLRGASFAMASFHLGGSGSGVAPGGHPGQGRRTGFYRDARRNLAVRDPDSVRVADLREVNLHGARIDACDFYLVDLRGALYDRAQEEHLRRCGAIL
jgi:uncharacterized protein YjbI with pentapeptide repeats